MSTYSTYTEVIKNMLLYESLLILSLCLTVIVYLLLSLCLLFVFHPLFLLLGQLIYGQ